MNLFYLHLKVKKKGKKNFLGKSNEMEGIEFWASNEKKKSVIRKNHNSFFCHQLSPDPVSHAMVTVHNMTKENEEMNSE